MFNWIRNAFRRWRKRQQDKPRLIYRYHDGEEWRAADPWLLCRQLLRLDLVESMPLVERGVEPETTQAVESLAGVFGVKRFGVAVQVDQGTGLTDWEIIRLLIDFEEYMAAVKKNIAPGPTSLPSTAPGSSASLGHQPRSEPTNSSSPCGSKQGEPTPVMPTPS